MTTRPDNELLPAALAALEADEAFWQALMPRSEPLTELERAALERLEREVAAAGLVA